MKETADIVIVGGGLVGLATARAILKKNSSTSLILIEKEMTPASHQSTRNSGVIHSGIYYKPGSLKAKNCIRGRSLIEAFAEEHGIAFERCGKIVLATNDDELQRLKPLYERGEGHGLRVSWLDQKQIKSVEPHAEGLAAIHVPETGIIDFHGIAHVLAREVVERDGRIFFNSNVVKLKEEKDTVEITTNRGTISARCLINCAGLYSDVIAQMLLGDLPYRIIPFRGEYYELTPEAAHLCRTLIYPMPDLRFPFLGVHLTKMIAGGVECGPNAVFAFAREGYSWSRISWSETAMSLRFPGFKHFVKRHWKIGLGEMVRSLSKESFAASLRKLVPEIRKEHLVKAAAGVRAQAMNIDGSLVDDFLIERSRASIHVLNAPSPAATSCLSIGESIAELVG